MVIIRVLRSAAALVLLLGFTPFLRPGGKLVDDFSRRELYSPLGGQWQAESDAAMGGSSRAQLAWVQKHAAPGGGADGNKKSAGPQRDGMLKLSFELRPNPQVKHPDAAGVLSLRQSADFSRYKSLEVKCRLDLEEGECFVLLVFEMSAGRDKVRMPVGTALSVTLRGEEVNCRLAVSELRVMKWWTRLYPQAPREGDWRHVRAVKLIVMSDGPCRGSLAVDEISLLE